jgi:hypothetical protein
MPASCWIFAWLNLQPWSSRRHVPPKRQLIFKVLHDVRSHKIKPFYPVFVHSKGWILYPTILWTVSLKMWAVSRDIKQWSISQSLHLHSWRHDCLQRSLKITYSLGADVRSHCSAILGKILTENKPFTSLQNCFRCYADMNCTNTSSRIQGNSLCSEHDRVVMCVGWCISQGL